MNLLYSPVFKCPPETSAHCQWMYYFTHFELLAMLFEVSCFLLVIYTTIKSPFHYNLKFITLFMLLGYFVFLVGRFITCLYEIGAITFPDEDIADEKYPLSLLISSLLQFFYMGCACGISLDVAFERFFATYFVDTYETRKRKWISLLFYIVLFMMNRRRLEKIQEERVDDKYSLSVRFQLSENLKVMTLLRNVVIFSGVNNLIMGIILTLYMTKSFQSAHPVATLYLRFAFNVCVIIYSLLIPVIMIFSVKQYRLHFFSLGFVRLILFPVVGRCFPNEFSSSSTQERKMTISAETDCYFANLSNQWDKKFDKQFSH
ncbi:unnamed protein product [Caenorhabditis sp. 36 PRJEB53466]|nr:unnamed protein product [Caenorhabditis sp. 36 PRJEB53466]